MTIAIIVHGGAWEMPDAKTAPLERGCVRAARIGHTVLANGGTAVDAVEAAIRDLEDDEAFDAGFGSFLNRDGVPEHDAGIMDGSALRSGAVAGVTGVQNPIVLARLVMESGSDCLVVGAGAEMLAGELGLERVPPESLAAAASRAYWDAHRSQDPRSIFTPHPAGTVGAVALDARGHIAAGTSTGGLPGKHPGRVGDSPLVGCGFFADSLAAGASSTGYGEAIMTVGLARRIVALAGDGRAIDVAVREAVAALDDPRIQGRAGAIALDRTGAVGAAFNTSRMARAWIDGGGTAGSGVDR